MDQVENMVRNPNRMYMAVCSMVDKFSETNYNYVYHYYLYWHNSSAIKFYTFGRIAAVVTAATTDKMKTR